jgi:hypothetical protein
MYHSRSWFDPSNLTGSPEQTYQADPTRGPVSLPTGAGGPTFHGYGTADDDPSYPGAE